MNNQHLLPGLLMTAVILLSGLLPVSCTSHRHLNLEITEPSGIDRVTETVEIPYAEIARKLKLRPTDSFVILDPDGKEQPYQLTSDQTVIFPVTLKASETRKYSLISGRKPVQPDTIACGAIYPARFDDLAWENDKVAFRAYGPTLQRRGDKAFGYDLFAKRGTSAPVLAEMYRLETDAALKARIKYLRENGHKEEGDALHRSKSYHVDKGHGMDCYAVGATLGAGTAALVDCGKLVYPWCWENCEFLDNGPYRFKVRLTFTPLNVNGHSNVLETRIITLDAGARLNKTEITYSSLDEAMPIVSGIVIHDRKTPHRLEAEKGYISYQDPTTGPDNGELYIGHAYAEEMEAAEVVYFEKEPLPGKKGPEGHVLACSTYVPGTTFTYWWGFGWNRADIQDYEAWNAYMETFTAQLRQPLVIHLR